MNDAAERPLRVLEVETFGRGGLIHYAWNLSVALAERGAEVELVTAAGCELAGASVPSGMRLTEAVGRRASRPSEGPPGPVDRLALKTEALFDARRVSRLARQRAPDLIHLHNTNTSAIAYLAALKRTGIPLVATSHVVTPHERIAMQAAVYGKIHTLPDLLIAHSEVDRRRLQNEFSVAPGKVEVIPHGDYGFFAGVAGEPDREAARAKLGLEPDAPVALFFGYLREYKGLDVLLDAWPEIARRVPGARLVIAGDPVRLGSERRAALEAEAEAVGAVHRFEYIPLEEVAGYFAAADLLALPYRHISQSGVLYLALALGVPVVASAVGAWPEMLDDGANALLVEPGSTASLADAVARVLGDPALRSRLREGGYALAEDHSWAKVAARTESAFRQLLAEQPP